MPTFTTKESKEKLKTVVAVQYNGENLDDVLEVMRGAKWRLSNYTPCDSMANHVMAIMPETSGVIFPWKTKSPVLILTRAFPFILNAGDYVVGCPIDGELWSPKYEFFYTLSEKKFKEKFA